MTREKQLKKNILITKIQKLQLKQGRKVKEGKRKMGDVYALLFHKQ